MFLTDTLAPPVDAAGVQPHLAFLSAPMVAERREADAVKRDAPILIVMGHPPYKRLRAGDVRDSIPQLIRGTMERTLSHRSRARASGGVPTCMSLLHRLPPRVRPGGAATQCTLVKQAIASESLYDQACRTSDFRSR